MMRVGDAGVLCPSCGEVILVPVTAELTTDGEGRQYLACDSDMADLWAHAWTHEGEPG